MPPSERPPVRTVAPARPFAWLALGWRDMLRSPLPSLLHGLVVAVGGWLILWLGSLDWLLLPGAVSGFLLVGPIIATGLYQLSRRQDAGRRAAVSQVFKTWQAGTRPLVGLGVLLFAAGSAWVAATAALFKAFVHVPIADLRAFLLFALTQQGSLLFWLWMLAGALGSCLVFSLTAVSAPLLLDRRIGLMAALLTSVRAVGDNPVAMALWAALIMAGTSLSLFTWMAGFLVVVPVLGHATWHAYRDLVDAEAWTPRD
jgi:uncharacterized membrane protein